MPVIARIYLQDATRRTSGATYEELDASYRYVAGDRTSRWSWQRLNARKGVWVYGDRGPQSPDRFAQEVREDAEAAVGSHGEASLDVLGSMEVGTIDSGSPRTVDAFVSSCVPVALQSQEEGRYLLCHKAPTTQWTDIFQTARAYGLLKVTLHCPTGSSSDAAEAAARAGVTLRVGTPWESNAPWVLGGGDGTDVGGSRATAAEAVAGDARAPAEQVPGGEDGPGLVPGSGPRPPTATEDSVPGSGAGSFEPPIGATDEASASTADGFPVAAEAADRPAADRSPFDRL